MYYLDTNIFLYTVNKKASENKTCLKLLDLVKKNPSLFTTSCETFQEIINVSQKAEKKEMGIRICREVLRLIPEPLPINTPVTKLYLELSKTYLKVDSRDLLHLAVCVFNRIETVVTYDKHFQKFNEIKALTPEDIL